MRPNAFLHVANGTCTTRLIHAAGIPGASSIWADPLYEGPVPGDVTDEALIDVRRRHLSRPGESAFATAGGDEASLDPANDLRAWRDTIARYESYEELVLWFEHDLFDQLNLIQLLAWIHERLPGGTPVSLVCIGSFPGRPAFRGLGELTADELASLLDTRESVGAGQYALASRAWQAFRAPTPERLDDLRRGDTSALPYLSAAVTRFLQEYPWTSDGLSRTERRLLELAAADGMTLSAALHRMHHGEDAYYITDLSLAALAGDLSRTTPPLLTIGPEDGSAGEASARTVRPTDVGRAALEGRCDRVVACGIDRWLGGVHVQGRGTVWRWDDARQGIVRATMNDLSGRPGPPGSPREG